MGGRVGGEEGGGRGRWEMELKERVAQIDARWMESRKEMTG
jgi:hypothetical protein